MRTSGKNIFQGQLTIGVDLGDRSSAYCVLNEAGEIVLEHKLATTPEANSNSLRPLRERGAQSLGR
jgi:predicted NBD/HSP70 family sugar kinase